MMMKIQQNSDNKYEEKIEEIYYGQIGIIKRTIGTGKVNVKVYILDEGEERDNNISYNSFYNESNLKEEVNSYIKKSNNKLPNKMVKKPENKSIEIDETNECLHIRKTKMF